MKGNKIIKTPTGRFLLNKIASFIPNITRAPSNDSQNDYIQVAEKVLEKFYENKDLSKNNNINQYLYSHNLKAFLDKKAKLHQYITSTSSLAKEEYKITSKIIYKKGAVSTILLRIAVDVSFKYVDLKNVKSGYGEIVEMLLISTEDGYKVKDLCISDNYYDSFIRGEFPEYLPIDKISGIELRNKQKKLRKFIDKNSKEEGGKALRIKEINDFSTQNLHLRALYPLNRANIVEYALNNAGSPHPASGNGVVPYYDFSQIDDNFDCTNFISHSLLAGGATVYNNSNPATGWYFVNLSNRSYSWSSVEASFRFLTTNTRKGPAGTSFPYEPFDRRDGYPFGIGDIIQHNNGRVWRHSTIVTGFYQYDPFSPYYVGALVTGRTSASRYNYNQKVEEIYPGNSKRVIKLIGNYK